ncbi:MAG: hypothetical protein ACK55I_01120, partial [bacterium]
GKPELKEKIDQALTELQPEIKKLQKKYGFPQTAPVVLDAKGSWNSITEQVAVGTAQAGIKKFSDKGLAKISLAGGSKTDLQANMIKVADVDMEEVKAMFN